MSAKSHDFLSHLKESGLLGADQLAEVRDRIDDKSVDECISGMVQRGWLTAFQVKQLHAGQSKGLVLGQYHILDELGRGGYGCVYKARHKLMDRVVAVKVIAPDLVADARARTWFRREVFAATQLNHPNIVLAYDADEVDNILFFAMEYVDGLNLEMLVRKRGALPIGMACELMNQAAKALQYAHEKGMVHRDIKPANMLIPRDAIADSPADVAPGTAPPAVLVKVVDFGLARLQKSAPHNTLVLQSEKGFVGTPAYVSPEQARNVHDTDIRSDLYSLGCSLYFALAGRPPFKGESVMELLTKHLESEAAPLERRRPEIPPALASIVRRLMAKKPEKRFQTPAELIAELGFFFSNDRAALNRAAPAFHLAPDDGPELDGPVDAIAATNYQPTDGRDVPMACPSSQLPGPATLIVDHIASPGGTHPCDVSAAPDRWENSAPLHEPTEILTTHACEPQSPVVAPLPASDGPPIPVADSLIRAWQLWTGVVASLMNGAWPDVPDAAYRELHRRLLDECRNHAALANLPQKTLFVQMADLVEPWLTLGSLPVADRAALASLDARCRRYTAALGCDENMHWKWVAAFFAVIIATFLGWLAFQNLESLPNLAIAKPMTLISDHPWLLAAAFVPVAVGIVLYLVRQARRTS